MGAATLGVPAGDTRCPSSPETGTTRARSRLPHFELTGPENAPLVIALGGISATAHVSATREDASDGWWQDVVGAGRAVDTARYRVLGIAYLDHGIDAGARGPITTHDQADAVVAVLDAIGVRRAHAVVGASYGGMVALAMGERYPERVARLVVISAAHEAHAMSTGLRAMQRRVVQLGLDTGRGREALVIARGIAMTTYRTGAEFASRFAAGANDDATPAFEVEKYLVHCGERFASVFTPERFLELSLSTDLHRVRPEAVRVPAVLVAAEGDTLIPREQMVELSARYGAPNRLVHVPTIYGHDAFLTEPARIGAIVADALAADPVHCEQP